MPSGEKTGRGEDHINFKNRVGEKFITNEGYEVEIVEYFRNDNCSIKFTYNNLIIKNIKYICLLRKNIKNPLHLSVCNIGYLGVKEENYDANIEKKIYSVWNCMLQRCYNTDNIDNRKTYKEIVVCKEWHNFQNFIKWCINNYNFETIQGWHLDKDILIKGNKVYSPKTCCFVPNEINALFTKRDSKRGKHPIGVSKDYGKFKATLRKTNLGRFDTPEEAFQAYKTAKEEYIKEVADKWKDLINPRVYQAMYNYQVEITD